MAETDIPSCDAKGKSIHVAEKNGGGQTDQGNASANSEIRSCDSKGKENTNSDKNGARQTYQGSPSAESWLIQVKAALEDPHKMRRESKNVSIYRVPEIIMRDKPEAYEPTLVSLGPYHHKNNPKLSTMDENKLEAVHTTLGRLKGKKMEDLISEIQKSETKIRNCYEESIEWNGEKLSWIVAIDACFVLEFLRGRCRRLQNGTKRHIPTPRESRLQVPKCSCQISCLRKTGAGYLGPRYQDPKSPQSSSENEDPKSPQSLSESCRPRNQDPKSPQSSSESCFSDWFSLQNDILKLENQIPLFILIEILKLEFEDQAESYLAKMLIRWGIFKGFPFIPPLLTDKHQSKVKVKVMRYIKDAPYHLLDLYRRVVIDVLMHSSSESANQIKSPTQSPDDSRSTFKAELLEKAGIKFQAGQLGFEKRRFGSSTLCLPPIAFDASTETLMRNLLAYEECQRCSWSPEVAIISHYIYILNDLIDTEKDVSILRKAKVIESAFGSDKDLANMLNQLSNGITFTSVEQFEMVMKDAREHYNSQWKVWFSQFKEEHISKPWYVISLVVGLAILVMTAVQTVYSVKK